MKYVWLCSVRGAIDLTPICTSYAGTYTLLTDNAGVYFVECAGKILPLPHRMNVYKAAQYFDKERKRANAIKFKKGE